MIQKRDRALPIPKTVDAYILLTALVATGLLRHEGDRIEWLHQILQENLSIAYSSKRFSKFIEICTSILCPCCGYRADSYYEESGKLHGICSETENDFVVELPVIPKAKTFKRKIKLVDRTGLPSHPEGVATPNSYIDEGYMARLPVAGMVYIGLLSHLQSEERQKLIDRYELQEQFGSEGKLLFDLEVWALVEAGVIKLRHKNHVTTAYVYLPAVNPSVRHISYTLVTLRHMSYEELEEDPEERFGITSEEKERYFEERRAKNLPIPHHFPFIEKDKMKVFRIAQKYGGQVRRSWGNYEEVVAEFPGEAWDFSKYASEG
jgi:hypothetical protein